MKIEIDSGSGFCFGVTTAIKKAEEELDKGHKLYCLGDIVHNGTECERLRSRGLQTIEHEEFSTLHDSKVLLRAHGEPPQTYRTAQVNNVEIIDATCPVVLALQRRIRRQYEDDRNGNRNSQIVIFGKNGHAEVLGLVGQTEGSAIVIEHIEDIMSPNTPIDFTRDIHLYSQTTKSLEEYHQVIEFIKQNITPDRSFSYHDTICRQVANRISSIRSFATKHELLLFVSGKKSSNGKVLFNECLAVNSNAHHIEAPEEIDPSWLEGINSIGICGATSTPKWLMEHCRDYICDMNQK